MRTRFEIQLEQLNADLIEMGALCESAIAACVKALIENNVGLADNAIEIDKKIDRKEHEIESLCLRLLLLQQPVARDLRLISAALKMITDMERIGDQASDIAQIVKVAGLGAVNAPHIRDMAAATIKMVTSSVDAYVAKNLTLAREVIAADDDVDALFKTVRNEIADIISVDPDSAIYALDLLMIAKYFERIGDHATNIAEWVEFSITGVHVGDEMR